MSAFYGQVFGKAATAGTREGREDIKVSAQSWNGSVITRMFYNRDNVLSVEIETSEDSASRGYTIFRGTFEEFKKKLGGATA